MFLGPRAVYVRYLTVENGAPGELVAVLSPEERDYAARFHFERDRTSYVAAHGMLRVLLSDLIGDVEPRDWRFAAGVHGKPQLTHSRLTNVRFSISHTHGMAACAVACGREVGVDVEAADRPPPFAIMADWFTPAEAAEIASRPIGSRADQFFFVWTLKEAYVKARGYGLRLPLKLIDIGQRDGRPTVSTPQEWNDDTWHVEHRRLERHHLAVCVQRGAVSPVLDVRTFPRASS